MNLLKHEGVHPFNFFLTQCSKKLYKATPETLKMIEAGELKSNTSRLMKERPV